MKKNKFKEKEKKVAYDIAAPAKEEKKKVLDFENEGTRFLVILLAIVAIISMLWLVNILKENKNNSDDDLSKHDIFKIKERCQELYTTKLKQGLSVKEIAEKLNKTEDEVKAIFSYFDTLNTFERDLANIDTKSR